MTTISATKARSKLYDLIEEVSTLGKRIAITSRGETKAVLINPDEIASLEATFDVLSDSKLTAQIDKGLKDIRAGQVIPWEEVKRKIKT